MTIRLVDHINVQTHRLEETRDFYVEILGLTEGYRPELGFPGYWLYAGDRAVVHMQEAKGPVGPSTACALNHAAFEVSEIDPLLARLEARGIPYDARDVPGTTIRQAFFLDPNGVRLEFNCPPR